MHSRLIELLNTRKPSRRGIHGTADWSTPKEQYVSEIPEWLQCGFSWVKLVAGGDSQRNFCQWLQENGIPIIPVIRLYYNDAPLNHVAPDSIAPYIDQGVLIFESPANEFYADYENIWRSSEMTPERYRAVAEGWGQFADSVLRGGGIPTTPSIEVWKWNHFTGLFDILFEHYRDLLKQSIVAMHNRPLNHPIGYVEDSGGYRGWEFFDRYILEHLGEHLPLLATEAGPEIGWWDDRRFPRVDVDVHTAMVREIVLYPTPDYYLADCFWLWRGSGAFEGASWKNSTHMNPRADLPIIRVFKEMSAQPPVIQPPDLSALDAVARDLGLKMWGRFPWVQKEAVRRGVIQGIAGQEFGFMYGGKSYVAQLFVAKEGRTVVFCEEGHYTSEETRTVQL